MAHINERLLECVSYGTVYGSGYRTDVVALQSGYEKRTALWSIPRGQFSIIYNLLKEEDHASVLAAFHVCNGRLHTFRLKDETDFSVVKSPIGAGTGSTKTYKLSRRFSFAGQNKDIPVSLPVVGSVVVYEGSSIVPATVDYENATVTLSAAPGAVISWSGEFDKRVRFDEDDIAFTFETRAGGVHPRLSTDITLQEVLS